MVSVVNPLSVKRFIQMKLAITKTKTNRESRNIFMPLLQVIDLKPSPKSFQLSPRSLRPIQTIINIKIFAIQTATCFKIGSSPTRGFIKPIKTNATIKTNNISPILNSRFVCNYFPIFVFSALFSFSIIPSHFFYQTVYESTIAQPPNSPSKKPKQLLDMLLRNLIEKQ